MLAQRVRDKVGDAAVVDAALHGGRDDDVPDALDLALPAVRGVPGRRRDVDLRAVAGAWRHDVGFRLELSGDLDGAAEFWLEPGWGGTVVNCGALSAMS